MFSFRLLAIAASLSTTLAASIQGFNYGSTLTDGSAKSEQEFQTEFSNAKGLAETNGAFSSARIYTMIQANTANNPIAAIPAAIAADTSLLLGVWASAGQDAINNEIIALKQAISQYGTAFTSRVTAISVGSEDLYRITPTGIAAKAGVGADPATIASYISQVRKAVAGTSLSGVPIGHVDTWTAWVNSTNQPVIDASDFIGMDAYPYFQNSMPNSIDNAYNLFFDALSQTKAAVGGKPVWVTETGWPVSGPTENQAIPSTDNAKKYWDQVGCKLFGNTNTYWYTVQDAAPTTPSPSFGVIASMSTKPLYSLSCSAVSSSSSSASSSATTSASGSASASSAAGASSAAAATTAAGIGSPGLSPFSSLDSAAAASSTAAPNSTAAAPSSSMVTIITMTAGPNGTATTLTTTIGVPLTTTVGAGSVGTSSGKTGPTPTGASPSISTGAAITNAGSFGGLIGAMIAVVALL